MALVKKMIKSSNKRNRETKTGRKEVTMIKRLKEGKTEGSKKAAVERVKEH
jgi:hypothetical protein